MNFIFWQLDGSRDLQDNDESLQRYLYEQYDACPETVDGARGAFIVGKYVTAQFWYHYYY